MPPISEQKRGGGTAKPASLPDRDNPLAWKRATKVGKLGALDLLKSLTDEEVSRYVDVARDQIRLEERWLSMKIACAICGAGLVAFFLWRGFDTGFGQWTVAGLGLGLVMGYWPWRVWKCRQLWQIHFNAALAEQARRSDSSVQ